MATSTPAAPPAPGKFAKVTDAEGNITRVGLVIDAGRKPNPDKGESPEPVILWLAGEIGTYGGELGTL